MALELKDRIYTNCVSTGTDDAWIGETKEGYQGWEAITPNATVYYCITDDTSWEVGYGNYVNAFGAGDKADKAIKRNLLSSNTGALLDLSGNASIFLTYPSEKAVILNTDDNIELPDTNVRFKNVTSDQVTSPVIATEAIIVDGTAGSGGSLAELLDVYNKEEVDDFLEDKADREETEQALKDLDEVVGEIAPSFDKGVWLFDSSAFSPNSPAEGKFVLVDDVTYTNSFEDANGIIFANKDYKGVNHTFSDVSVGNYVELVNSDGSFLLATIVEKVPSTNEMRFNIEVVSSAGTPRVGTSKVKFFTFTDAELDLSSYMPKVGGTFTGEVEFDKTITINNNFTQVRASVEKPFHTIKTNAPVNPDGSQNTDNPFGFAVDIDHNNTFKNQFVVQNRKGEILSIKGGGSPYGKLDFDWTYRGIINQDHHLVNKKYVDNNLHTLSSEGNKLNWALGKSLISTQWATDTNNPETAKIYYFYKLHDYTGDEVQVNKYKTTPSTMLEIWKQGNLIVKTSLVAFEESTYSTADTQARVSGLNVTTHADELFDSDSNYGIVISNLQLKEEV